MTKIKKLFLIAIFVLLTGIWSLPVLAVDVYTQLGALTGEQGADLGTPNDPRLIAAYTIQVILGTLGVVFLAYLVYAGYLILLSGGSEEKITQGKKVIWQAVLGVAITITAFSISIFVVRYLRQATISEAPSGFYANFNFEIEDDTRTFYNDPMGGDTGMPDFLKF